MISTASSYGHTLVTMDTIRASGTVASMKALSSAQSRARAPCTTRQADVLNSGHRRSADSCWTNPLDIGASHAKLVGIRMHSRLRGQASAGAGYQPSLVCQLHQGGGCGGTSPDSRGGVRALSGKVEVPEDAWGAGGLPWFNAGTCMNEDTERWCAQRASIAVHVRQLGKPGQQVIVSLPLVANVKPMQQPYTNLFASTQQNRVPPLSFDDTTRQW